MIAVGAGARDRYAPEYCLTRFRPEVSAHMETQLDSTHATLVHYAAAKGRLKLLALVLDHPTAPGGVVDIDGQYGEAMAARGGRCLPLHVAAVANQAGAVGVLLARGAAISPRDCDGYDPLFLAARFGRDDAVAALLRPPARAATLRLVSRRRVPAVSALWPDAARRPAASALRPDAHLSESGPRRRRGPRTIRRGRPRSRRWRASVPASERGSPLSATRQTAPDAAAARPRATTQATARPPTRRRSRATLPFSWPRATATSAPGGLLLRPLRDDDVRVSWEYERGTPRRGRDLSPAAPRPKTPRKLSTADVASSQVVATFALLRAGASLEGRSLPSGFRTPADYAVHKGGAADCDGRVVEQRRAIEFIRSVEHRGGVAAWGAARLLELVKLRTLVDQWRAHARPGGISTSAPRGGAATRPRRRRRRPALGIFTRHPAAGP